MDNKSTLSRRAFLAGAATCAAAAPALLHSAVHTPFRPTLLHVATRVSHSGYVHTFLLASDGCTLLGSTRIDSFAAFAVHPVLPILYVARDCREWEDSASWRYRDLRRRTRYAVRCDLLHRRRWLSPQLVRAHLACRRAAGICSFRHPRVERGMLSLSIPTVFPLSLQSLGKRPASRWSRVLFQCQLPTAWSFRLMGRTR